MNFYEYESVYRIARRVHKQRLKKIGWEQYYNTIFKEIRIYDDVSTETKIDILNEYYWYRLGCPYFKVWPALAENLAFCDVKIPADKLIMPFDVFEIRLPNERLEPYWSTQQNNSVKAMLCMKWENSFFVYYQFSTMDIDEHRGYFICLELDKSDDVTLEFLIEQVIKFNCDVESELSRNLMRLAIAVTFFGVDAHEIVAPDVPRKFLTKYIRAKKENNKSETKKILEKAKKMGMFGWKLGSEIDLPRPSIRYEYLGKPGERKELKYSHIRRGHLALRKCGEGRKEEKVVFIKPTVVRPDLPLGTQRGYRIGRN